MIRPGQRKAGFTIVELLIVIVVIAILAAISIVAYNGIQNRARDTERVSEAQAIVKAIWQYHAVNGSFPQETPSPGISGFEASTDSSGTFLEHLRNAGFLSSVPVDPTNNANHYYGYHVYEPGWGGGANGCDDNRGNYFVVMVSRFESITNAPHPSSPGFSCTSRNWQGSSSSQWVSGGYAN